MLNQVTVCCYMSTYFFGVYIHIYSIYMDQNCVNEEIKSRLYSGNVYCNSVRNILSSSLLSKSMNEG